MREQRVVLEHHADAPLFRRHSEAASGYDLPMEEDLAIGRWLEARDAAEHGVFPQPLDPGSQPIAPRASENDRPRMRSWSV